MAIVIGDGCAFDTADLTAGVKFATDYEDGCEVVTGPDSVPGYEPAGTFYALDSEHVECLYHVSMVQFIHRTS